MKNLHYLLSLSIFVPACDKEGNLGEHSTDSAASEEGGEEGGEEPDLCLSEEDCDPGEACDHSECLSNCPENGEACPDVCYGQCVGAGGSGEGGSEGGEGGNTCDMCPDPAPGAPNYICPDGTVAGPACLIDAATGVCDWGIITCPEHECTEEECGPAPGAPSYECPDGSLGGPGPCQQLEDGTCGYPWIDCPTDETGGGECVDEGASCAAGEACCGGLNCCAGVPVPPGDEYCGIECPISDRAKKENFEAIDAKAVLEKVTQLDLFTWNYTFEDPSIRHLGPMAQDFKASFEVGASDKSIFVVDADGVALASIQALNHEVETLEAENTRLATTVQALEKRLSELERRR